MTSPGGPAAVVLAGDSMTRPGPWLSPAVWTGMVGAPSLSLGWLPMDGVSATGHEARTGRRARGFCKRTGATVRGGSEPRPSASSTRLTSELDG